MQVSNVTGRLRIDAGMMTLESLQAGLGETGRANLNGKVTFNPEAPQPYALTADVALREFVCSNSFFPEMSYETVDLSQKPVAKKDEGCAC